MAWVVRGYARTVIKRNHGSPQAIVRHMRRVMQGPTAMQALAAAMRFPATVTLPSPGPDGAGAAPT